MGTQLCTSAGGGWEESLRRKGVAVRPVLPNRLQRCCVPRVLYHTPRMSRDPLTCQGCQDCAPTMVAGPISGVGLPSVVAVSITASMISGAEEPSAISVRFATCTPWLSLLSPSPTLLFLSQLGARGDQAACACPACACAATINEDTVRNILLVALRRYRVRQPNQRTGTRCRMPGHASASSRGLLSCRVN